MTFTESGLSPSRWKPEPSSVLQNNSIFFLSPHDFTEEKYQVQRSYVSSAIIELVNDGEGFYHKHSNTRTYISIDDSMLLNQG